MPQLANVKCDMFINGGGAGWVETHWHTSPYTTGSLLTGPWVQAAINLCEARVALLNGYAGTLVACRLSAGNVYRDSLVMKPGRGLIGPPPTIISKNSDSTYNGGFADDPKWNITPQVSLPLLMIAGNGQYRGTTYITTLDNRYYTGGAAGGPTSQGLAYVAQYVNHLVTQGDPNITPGGGAWGMPVRVVTGVATTAISTITFAAPVPPNPYWTMTIVLQGNTTPTLAAGAQVRLSGMTIKSTQKRIRFNGTYTIATYTAPATFTINMPKVIIAPASAAGGTCQTIPYTVLPYQSGSVGAPTHHKRGRPTFSPAGRVRPAA